jgi:glycosyltransferase involved in cell wall biosynthesis
MKLLVEVSHTAHHDVRTGIQAVVRGLLAGLEQVGANFQTVTWSRWRNRLIPLDQRRNESLGISAFGVQSGSAPNRDQTWLLLPEVVYGRKLFRMIAHARKQWMRIAAIFHDAIPVTHPELVRREAQKFHPAYMMALGNVDLIVAVSHSAAEQCRLFLEKRFGRYPTIYVCPSAGELTGEERAKAKSNANSDVVNILCVSTLEPRKNHKTLIQAFELACSAVTHPKLCLHLVGDRYKDADHLVEFVKAAMVRNPNLIWHGRISDRELVRLYHESDFTVYPSMLEGFGLAITQSLWNRRPCICADHGAMAEIANEGGCLTVDVRDVAKLSDAISALATNPDLRQKLVDEIERRSLRTWRAYASDICQRLEQFDRLPAAEKM